MFAGTTGYVVRVQFEQVCNIIITIMWRRTVNLGNLAIWNNAWQISFCLDGVGILFYITEDIEAEKNICHFADHIHVLMWKLLCCVLDFIEVSEEYNKKTAAFFQMMIWCRTSDKAILKHGVLVCWRIYGSLGIDELILKWHSTSPMVLLGHWEFISNHKILLRWKYTTKLMTSEETTNPHV